ncbi:nucleoside phosphorylase [Geobacter pelophilus]|uniref:Nucleoside phosphorylase n=1 Tax=Geoanaerobacter pelophilus TaxID=60036 RepID=A0AAW4L7K3_9BACT|nr:nucleoside phosphorylase [Geoanaerobacter pelophilus]
MQRLGLIAAMQEEIQPLLRIVKPSRMEVIGKRHVWWLGKSESICLVESGMGPDNAATATRLLIDIEKPELIVNFGFAGSLTSALCVGDIVMADRLLFMHGRLFSEQSGLSNDLSRRHTDMQEKCGCLIHQGSFVTTRTITAKKEIAGRLPAGIAQAVVEMETAAVAQVANKEKIPLLALRAISDGFDDELGFSLDEFCDKDLNLQKWRVMLTLAKKPWIIPQLIRLAGNTKQAGRKLAMAVAGLLVPTP